MGFMDELKKLTKPYAEEDDVFEEETQEEVPVRQKSRQPIFDFTHADPEPAAAPKTSSPVSKVVNINATAQMQVVLAKPVQYDMVSEIANHLLDNHAVVLNLETTNKDVSRRLVDFLSGCAFALDGSVKKIAVATYLITPKNVNIVGDVMEELGNSGMYL